VSGIAVSPILRPIPRERDDRLWIAIGLSLLAHIVLFTILSLLPPSPPPPPVAPMDVTIADDVGLKAGAPNTTVDPAESKAPDIGNPEDSLALIERVVDEARVALCAEAVGLMDESLKTTVEYIKTRKQFGVAIGSFQSLQHRASDMFVAAEQARSMSMFATMANDFENAKERSNAIAAAKVQIGKSLKFVGQQSIQLHGGIGMTMEAKIGHYFKRLTMIENTFGDTDYHLRRVTDAGGLI